MKRFNLDDLIEEHRQAVSLLKKVNKCLKEIDGFLNKQKGVKWMDG